ncbi:MAG: RnfH family protein [Granulosicoccus sp.]
MSETVTVKVVYALPEEQQLIEVELPAGTGAREALTIVLERNLLELAAAEEALGALALPIGVYGVAVDDKYLLKTGDRLEIYRPLQQDPKERRREIARRNDSR